MKTIVLLNIFMFLLIDWLIDWLIVGTMIWCLESSNEKDLFEIFCINVKVFNVTFDSFNTSTLNKSVIYFTQVVYFIRKIVK